MDMTTEKIAICIPTFLKDGILMDTINSILDNYQENWIILIGDQNKPTYDKDEKNFFYNSACSSAHTYLEKTDRIKIHRLPYNCGLSYARNELVRLANDLGIKYCLMTADSIAFKKSMQNINWLINYLNFSPDFNIDLLGLDLDGRIGWEAWLDLKEYFELDFIETYPVNTLFDKYSDSGFVIWQCDIVRNFFLATTKSLLNVPWDNEGKMSEHCPWFWEYKQAGYKVGWTDMCHGLYLPNTCKQYKEMRLANLSQGKKYYMKKYNLTRWTKYINPHNIKR